MPPRKQPELPVQDESKLERLRRLNDQELQRRVAAVKAIQQTDIESVLSRLRLIRTFTSKEQQETPALQFFKENCPNLSAVWNEQQNELELKWKEQGNQIIEDNMDENILHAPVPSLPIGGVTEFSGDSVKKNFIESLNLNFDVPAWSELPEAQLASAADGLQTPGYAAGNRLSFGMTPKSRRLPKNGEMLLSVRGSPLGVYKEENLAAVHEPAEPSNGSEDAAS